MNTTTPRVLAILLFVALHCAAHSVWIEPDAGGHLIIRFAEPDGRIEKSPGHLDELTPPLAWHIGDSNAPVALEVQKRTNHFLIVSAAITNAVQIETSYQVMITPGKPGRKPNFYARWQPAGAGAATPALTLDLVPTRKSGEVRAYFREQPLAGVKATLRTPDDNEQELTADAEGVLRFTSKQAGLHLLTIARHRETLPGFHAGLAYGVTSHNASLSWRQE